MARVTQEHRDARRRQILEAAARQFGAKGLEPGAATIDDIAKDAELSKGTIYTYFENKDELMDAITDSGVERDTAMFSELGESSPSAWDAFWAVFRQTWDSMLDPENRERNMLSFERLLVELRRDSSDRRVVDGPVGELTKMLEGAQSEGKVAADLDAHVLATTLWNCQQGTRAYILRTGNTETADAVLEMVTELVARTVGTDPASE